MGGEERPDEVQKQEPLIHEPGARPDEYDTNERADTRVRVEQPSGDEVPEVEQP